MSLLNIFKIPICFSEPSPQGPSGHPKTDSSSPRPRPEVPSAQNPRKLTSLITATYRNQSLHFATIDFRNHIKHNHLSICPKLPQPAQRYRWRCFPQWGVRRIGPIRSPHGLFAQPVRKFGGIRSPLSLFAQPVRRIGPVCSPHGPFAQPVRRIGHIRSPHGLFARPVRIFGPFCSRAPQLLLLAQLTL